MPMEFKLQHRAVKGMPVISLNTVTRVVHIQLLARQIHNARTLPTTATTLPARLRRSLPARLRRSRPARFRRSLTAAALLFSRPTAPCVMTVMRTLLLAAPRNSVSKPGGRTSHQQRQHLRDPNGYTHRCSGATVGDSHEGPLNN
jgi:hypothetical protein